MSGKMIGALAILVVGGLGWKVADTIGAEALAMAVGVLFGILAGIPMALLGLSSRNREGKGDVHYHYHPAPPVAMLAEPPVAITDVMVMGEEVEAMPGFQAWEIQGSTGIYLRNQRTGKEWTIQREDYFKRLHQQPKALLSDKHA